MLDSKFVLANVDAVKENCRKRLASDQVLQVDRIVELEGRWKDLLREVQGVRWCKNEIAQATGREKDPSRRAGLIAEGKRLKFAIGASEENLRGILAELDERLGRMPNMTHPDAPVETNRELSRVGAPRVFDFPAKDHVEIGRTLDLMDFEAGARVAGHGFYFLKNDGVLLDLALQNFALRTLIDKGFTPIITPDLARMSILEGIGFMPRGPETQTYSIADGDLCLIATAEITLGGMLAGMVLEGTELPLRYVGLSHCFRTEAGAPGRASRGLYRVHQFTKVEMFAVTGGTFDASGAMHREFLAIEEDIFGALGVPYRTLDIAAGDLGGPAYRKFDLEAWMPGRGDSGEYGEVTSTSDCTDYQARRLNIRYRPIGEKGTRFVHTLNGTAIATSRAMIAVLENYQRADGRVDVPEVLRPFLGKDIIGAH